jgi:hypothetical protein
MLFVSSCFLILGRSLLGFAVLADDKHAGHGAIQQFD